jgi:hypothetical protein
VLTESPLFRIALSCGVDLERSLSARDAAVRSVPPSRVVEVELGIVEIGFDEICVELAGFPTGVRTDNKGLPSRLEF